MLIHCLVQDVMTIDSKACSTLQVDIGRNAIGLSRASHNPCLPAQTFLLADGEVNVIPPATCTCPAVCMYIGIAAS